MGTHIHSRQPLKGRTQEELRQHRAKLERKREATKKVYKEKLRKAKREAAEAARLAVAARVESEAATRKAEEA